MKRSVAKLQYKDKLYTSFKPGKSITVPTVRAFDAADSGMVFQSSDLVDTGISPLLALFYADASFFGASMSHHPIYRELFLIVLVYIMHIMHIMDVIALMAISTIILIIHIIRTIFLI